MTKIQRSELQGFTEEVRVALAKTLNTTENCLKLEFNFIKDKLFVPSLKSLEGKVLKVIAGIAGVTITTLLVAPVAFTVNLVAALLILPLVLMYHLAEESDEVELADIEVPSPAELVVVAQPQPQEQVDPSIERFRNMQKLKDQAELHLANARKDVVREPLPTEEFWTKDYARG